MCKHYLSSGFCPNIPHVSMWGMPQFPEGEPLASPYENGGMVKEEHVNIPDGILKKDDPDRVLVRLMPNELVIPVKHVKKVVKFLKSQGIKLRGMK
jgi:hypothetical protein